MATTGSSTSFSEMDNAGISPEQLKIMFISGMGFFTDAYDLFVIGVVMALLKQQWHVTNLEESLVGSTALLASAIGAILFGRIADMLGRKRIYGVEVLVLAIGAVACAFSPNIWWLIGLRFVLGIGIGGDYPVSATIMSEYAGKCTRGTLVSMVFAMQAAGLILGPLLASGLLATHLSHNIVWRILVAFGAVPAMSVYWQRRQLKESPRYLAASGQREGKEGAEAKASQKFGEGFGELWGKPKLRTLLIGTSLAWFLMDAAYYGNTVSSPVVLSALGKDHTLLQKTLTQLGIFAIFAAPGYALSAWTMDKLGRKTIQCLGFAMMALTFALIAFIPNLTQQAIPFLVIYGFSFLFTEFGPNSTTFIYPAEVFSVRQRTTGHGIAAAMGKIGGFAGVFLFPYLMHWKNLLGAESAAAAVSVLGLLITVTMLPETKGRSLEDISGEDDASEPAGTSQPMPHAA